MGWGVEKDLLEEGNDTVPCFMPLGLEICCWVSSLFNICGSSSPSYGEGNGTPLQYSCLENPMDGGAWWAAVHGVAKSWARLSNFTFTFHFHALEKEMATHSSVLAWRIPGTEKPGGLPSLGSHRVGHNWRDLAAAAAANHMTIPVFWNTTQPWQIMK